MWSWRPWHTWRTAHPTQERRRLGGGFDRRANRSKAAQSPCSAQLGHSYPAELERQN